MFIKVGDRIINTEQIKTIELHVLMLKYIDGKDVEKDAVRVSFNDNGDETSMNCFDFFDAESEALRDYATTSLFDVDVMKYHTDRVVQRRRADAVKSGLCPDCGGTLSGIGDCNTCGYSKFD